MHPICSRNARRAAGALLLLLASACSSATDPASPAQLSVVLAEPAPELQLRAGEAGIVAARVTIARIYLQGETGRSVLSERGEVVDLLAADDIVSTLVQGAVLPAGRYHGLHVVVSGGYVEVRNADGSTSVYASSPDHPSLPPGASVAGQLVLPSFAESGLKVQIPGGVVLTEGQQSLSVSVDVSESFAGQAGLSGRWILTPVLRGERIS